ncbi:MAG: hypothetical protein NVS3B7_14030 [Candidatus Elarobacter sp.]
MKAGLPTRRKPRRYGGRYLLQMRFSMKRLGVLTLLLALAGTTGLGPAAAQPSPPVAAHSERAVLAGGCFWGLEAVFASLKGVTNVVSGYSGGAQGTAHYEIVSTGMTGHAESVEITFDPAKITYAQLLHVYFTVAHDPTQLDYQGPDHGSQYRSSVFYVNDGQKRAAEAAIRDLTNAKKFRDPIVTKVVPFVAFYPAESYHQHFLERNPTYPYVVYNDIPKLKELRARYPELIRPQGLVARV